MILWVGVPPVTNSLSVEDYDGFSCSCENNVYWILRAIILKFDCIGSPPANRKVFIAGIRGLPVGFGVGRGNASDEAPVLHPFRC